MRLLVDMNLSPRWAKVLQTAGHEAVHWSMLGAGNVTDVAIMTYAKNHDYVVITQDLDFGAILAATGGTKPSVVQIRSDELRPDAIAHSVLTALKQTEAELLVGALLTIDPCSARLRILPI